MPMMVGARPRSKLGAKNSINSSHASVRNSIIIESSPLPPSVSISKKLESGVTGEY